MHPEKYYISRDEPKKVTLPDLSSLLIGSWQRLDENVMGEFGFYLAGKRFLDELSNKVMSEGWGGDRYALYEDAASGKLLFISSSKWDSERDAQEFFSFYKDIVKKKYKEVTPVKGDPDYAQFKTEDNNVCVLRKLDAVVIIEGTPDSLVASLVSAFGTEKS
jgi:hypothetical protein